MTSASSLMKCFSPAGNSQARLRIRARRACPLSGSACAVSPRWLPSANESGRTGTSGWRAASPSVFIVESTTTLPSTHRIRRRTNAPWRSWPTCRITSASSPQRSCPTCEKHGCINVRISSVSSDPALAWHDFFIAAVRASAALLGLLFATISINLEHILKYPHLPGRAASTLGTLLTVLVICCFGLAPSQPTKAFGWEIVAMTLLAATQILWVSRHRDAANPLTWTIGSLPILPGARPGPARRRREPLGRRRRRHLLAPLWNSSGVHRRFHQRVGVAGRDTSLSPPGRILSTIGGRWPASTAPREPFHVRSSQAAGGRKRRACGRSMRRSRVMSHKSNNP